MSQEISISWSQFEEDCKTLARKIISCEMPFEAMVVLTRGGLCVAGVLSNILRIKNVSTLCLESYKNKGWSKFNILSTPNIGLPEKASILIVDDLVHTGRSMGFAINYVLGQGYQTHSAVLYNKNEFLSFEFYVRRYPIDTWIEFPWEK
jgi:xanthine phosphoribosyltransferase